jgi:hypothetical protein
MTPISPGDTQPNAQLIAPQEASLESPTESTTHSMEIQHSLGLSDDEMDLDQPLPVETGILMPLDNDIQVDKASGLDSTGSSVNTGIDTVSEPRPLESSLNAGQVIGQHGQLCADANVLKRVLEAYSHISSNVFKGGANGRIPTECMMCECRYDPENDGQEMACGSESDCINRALNIECPPDCPSVPFCLNQRCFCFIVDFN